MERISYMLVISQNGRSMKAKVVEVDPSNVKSDLEEIGRALIQQYPQSTIHYANSSAREVVVMQELELGEL